MCMCQVIGLEFSKGGGGLRVQAEEFGRREVKIMIQGKAEKPR